MPSSLSPKSFKMYGTACRALGLHNLRSDSTLKDVRGRSEAGKTQIGLLEYSARQRYACAPFCQNTVVSICQTQVILRRTW